MINHISFATDPKALIRSVSVDELAMGLECGPLDLKMLNAVLKLAFDKVAELDAHDNAITGASYDQATNILTFSMSDGPSVKVDLSDVIADVTAGIAAVPTGLIAMWSGSSVPSGWALCNGQNGTPDLRDRFVMGAGTVSTGSTGGNATHNHGITVSGHALNEAEIPAHRHAMFANVLADAAATGQGSIARGTTNSPGEEEYIMTSGGTNEPTIGTTGTSGNGNEHSHDAQSSQASSLPPFYALAFIMKV